MHTIHGGGIENSLKIHTVPCESSFFFFKKNIIFFVKFFIPDIDYIHWQSCGEDVLM